MITLLNLCKCCVYLLVLTNNDSANRHISITYINYDFCGRSRVINVDDRFTLMAVQHSSEGDKFKMEGVFSDPLGCTFVYPTLSRSKPISPVMVLSTLLTQNLNPQKWPS